MSNSRLMTIDRFNKLTGHETLHPLICMVDLSRTNLNEDIRMMCDFYGLLYYNDPEQDKISGKEWLRLIYPGETVEIPLNRHRHTGCCSGVLFHPDLLCDTSLENRIETYPKRCCCKGTFTYRIATQLLYTLLQSVNNKTVIIILQTVIHDWSRRESQPNFAPSKNR